MNIVSQNNCTFIGELCEPLLVAGGCLRHREFLPPARSSRRIASFFVPAPAATVLAGQGEQRCGFASTRSAAQGLQSEQASVLK